MKQPRSQDEARRARGRRDRAARKHKPESIELLLVAEAPPAALDRYFYFADVREQDSLFRYVCSVVLKKAPTREGKADLLSALKGNSVYLIDLQLEPRDDSDLTLHVPRLISRCRRLKPKKIILIKATVFDAAYSSLRNAELPVVNVRVPFPGSGQQMKFVQQMTKAMKAKVT